MDKQEIQLNFLPLKIQKFTFGIYRQEYNGEKITDDEIFVYKLPDTDGIYKKYNVCFSAKESFEEFQCDEETNRELSIKYLWHSLLLASKNHQTVIKEKKFDKRLYFVINELSTGKQTIFVSPIYLKISNQYCFLLDFHFFKNDGLPINKEVLKHSLSLDKNYYSNKFYYVDKKQFILSFINQNFKNLFQSKENSSKIVVEDTLKSLNSYQLNTKNFVFSNQRTHKSQFKGIEIYSPLKSLDADVDFIFIFDDSLKDLANNLYKGLKGDLNPGTFSGMEKMFKIILNNKNVERIKIENTSKDSLDIAVRELSLKNKNNRKKIVIFLENEGSYELSDKFSSYFYLKSECLKLNIPLQVVNYQKNSDISTLKWSLSSIALQIFSKLGGIPWYVEPSNNDCIVFGIGSSHKINMNNEIEKYYAYCVCLDSSGVYKKISVLSETSDHNAYITNLKNNLVSVLKEFRNYSKIAIHIPFKLRQSEIEAIQDSLNQIQKVEVKILKFNDQNKYFGYSNHNTCVPYESSFIQLDDREYLVWFDGLKYGKENLFSKPSNPVHIKFIDKSDSKNDISFLQDAINLSGANWRGFNAKQLPVSMFYSEILAKFIKAFNHYHYDNINQLTNVLPWFL